MPATYAHYRFGQRSVPTLPEDVRKAVCHFRQLYEVGHHGPDLFFYYQPLMRTKIGRLGHSFHMLSGKVFFENAVRHLEADPSEGALAYLYGVLGHYVLDTQCHPLIHEVTDGGQPGHTELETEFDRFLLERDGKTPPCLQNLGSHICLTPGECAVAAGFYPPAGASAIARSVRHMRLINRALAVRNRKQLERIFRLGGENAFRMVMPIEENTRCSRFNGQLLERFDRGLSRYPAMAEQLRERILYKKPLGEAFEANFG